MSSSSPRRCSICSISAARRSGPRPATAAGAYCAMKGVFEIEDSFGPGPLWAQFGGLGFELFDCEAVHQRCIVEKAVFRVAASIRTGTVTASLILRQLASYPRQNGLAVALRELGRLERTLFTLDWLEDRELRRQTGQELNKGETRNSLARAVFIHRLGEIRDRTYENQQHRASVSKIGESWNYLRGEQLQVYCACHGGSPGGSFRDRPHRSSGAASGGDARSPARASRARYLARCPMPPSPRSSRHASRAPCRRCRRRGP